MTLSPKLGVVGISTLWHFRLPLPIQMFIKVASSPRLSGIGMPSPILWSHPLKMQRIVLLSSLLWWELGTNSLITGPGEWLSFRRFTSKLSWSWSFSWGITWLIEVKFHMEERKFIHMILVTWHRRLPCPYIVKTFKNILLWNWWGISVKLGKQHRTLNRPVARYGLPPPPQGEFCRPWFS